MSLTVRKLRARGESAPVSPEHRETAYATSKRSKRARSASIETAMFDEDYKRYARAHFHALKRPQKPWTLDPPADIFDHKKLTEDIVQHMYDYAHYRLKLRRVSPRSLPFLQEYRDTAKEILDNTKPKLQEELKIKLAAWNFTLHSATILKREPTLQDKAAYKALKDITIFRYLAEYGDYLGEECKAFRAAAIAKKDKLRNVSVFCEGKTWQMVDNKLEAEKAAWNSWKVDEKGLAPKMEMTQAITEATSDLEIDLDHIFYTIKMYAKRNEMVHCMIDVYIKNCNWQALGSQLHKDIRDVPHVFGEKERKHMLAVLNSIKKRYFVETDDDPLNVITSEEANRRSIERTRKARQRQEAEKKQAEAQARKAAKVKQKKDDDDNVDVRAKRLERSQDEDVCMEGCVDGLLDDDSMDCI